MAFGGLAMRITGTMGTGSPYAPVARLSRGTRTAGGHLAQHHVRNNIYPRRPLVPSAHTMKLAVHMDAELPGTAREYRQVGRRP